MKVISSSVALSLVIGLAALGTGGISATVHAQKGPNPACLQQYRACLQSGEPADECYDNYEFCIGAG